MNFQWTTYTRHSVMCCGVVCIFLWNEKALFRKSFWKWFAMKRMCQSFQFIWREDQLNILDNVVIVKDLFSKLMWRKIVSWKLFCQHLSKFLNQKSISNHFLLYDTYYNSLMLPDLDIYFYVVIHHAKSHRNGQLNISQTIFYFTIRTEVC